MSLGGLGSPWGCAGVLCHFGDAVAVSSSETSLGHRQVASAQCSGAGRSKSGVVSFLGIQGAQN